jgi:2-polyprenyl-6-hydroxyphenyl methylase/3-demethylubiquinone-9 3-methyltransferase
MTGSVVPAEVERFEALAARWWDTRGPMAPLHAMNPARVRWILALLPAPALRILDVGCGAGLAAEAFARAGHNVLGIDAAAGPLDVARRHAARGLAVTYRLATAETLAGEGLRFDAVTALEVIEHVADPAAFVRSLGALLVPGGRLFLSTLNRTARSLVEAKLGAEYVMRLLPAGTHDWRRFVPPATLAAYCRGAGLAVVDTAGLRPNLFGRWQTGRDLSVNYVLCAERR